MRDEGMPEDQGLCVIDWVGGLAKEALERLVTVREQQRIDVSKDHLDHFMQALCKATSDDPAALLNVMQARHLKAEVVANHYVPAAARRLGEDWEADVISFVDVTVCTERLHGVLRHIDAQQDPGAVSGPSVLVLVPDTEQHTLGAFVVALELRIAGFAVTVRVAPLAPELTQLMAVTHFDIALISVGCRPGMASAAGLVKTLRLMSRGTLHIVAGGSVPVPDEELLQTSGADCVIRDLSTFLREYGPANAAAGVDRETKTGQMFSTSNPVKGGRLDK